jgi:hypothetical protein
MHVMIPKKVYVIIRVRIFCNKKVKNVNIYVLIFAKIYIKKRKIFNKKFLH